MGASHGIGYILGAICGVPHGYTSCVMLPAVLTWSERDAREAQKDIARAMGRPDEPAGKVMREFVSGLGLPVKLSDVDVGREQFQEIAERAARHPVVRANVRPIQSAGDVMEILELAG
jgi:maleylacetate reductase